MSLAVRRGLNMLLGYTQVGVATAILEIGHFGFSPILPSIPLVRVTRHRHYQALDLGG